ncbi:DUF3465 domain-containing protein [Aestuariicella hydrocarbonica]|uniref:DUF3465 domain-containing protein n=1 Tax=Pseudomaricurvus hydrocarbonicus TaxID=1470433 RepID=A0A9E5MPM5_9GAMM|nr:DUF3465 domain-containing protein [Aestuariicella hydrocarbonica]NHO68065.1 DUF3465 domain-containing protein [Aestuariicella hydrocarbonica]
MRDLKKWAAAGVIALALCLFYVDNPKVFTHPGQASDLPGPVLVDRPDVVHTPDVEENRHIVAAFERQAHDVQVQGSGVVIKVLRDDLKGSRHQRFIVRLTPELTVLIAHNIDLAPRIEHLTAGEVVAFYGEYEWNAKGGVIHWTHHDPAGRHVGGWLKYRGQTYQ